jgi:hypothetical protein
MFDQDRPRAREKAVAQRVLQTAEDANEVFIYLEYQSLEDATEARDRLLAWGVLDPLRRQARPYRARRRGIGAGANLRLMQRLGAPLLRPAGQAFGARSEPQSRRICGRELEVAHVGTDEALVSR